MSIEGQEVPDVIEQAVVADLPTNIDWRDQGIVTHVKNQGQCGSCWAFSATGSIEGAHANATGQLVSLSEQQLLKCDKIDHGCHGGLQSSAFKYIIKAGGITTEKKYPYNPKDSGECKFEKEDVAVKISGYKQIKRGSETDLQKAVAEVGPISIGIDAGHQSFQSYRNGIYNPNECSSSHLDHGILAVGYGHEEVGHLGGGLDYWLVKNSWGPSWGMHGYIKMIRNNGNKCGVATLPFYPTL